MPQQKDNGRLSWDDSVFQSVNHLRAFEDGAAFYRMG